MRVDEIKEASPSDTVDTPTTRSPGALSVKMQLSISLKQQRSNQLSFAYRSGNSMFQTGEKMM